MSEPVRAHLAIIQGVLAPLDVETRTRVLIALAVVEAEALAEVRKQLDDARAQLTEWKAHNDERMASVEEARQILGATAAETLQAAARRVMDQVDEMLAFEADEVHHLPGCGTAARGCVPGCENYDPKFDG